MDKLMKNWIFTLIVCILLAILAVLMFFSAAGVLPIGETLLKIIVAVILVLYAVFTLFPLVARYRGAIQVFVIVETAVLLVTAVAQACIAFVNIPLFSTLQAFSVFGLALWLRCAVETIHAYLLQGGQSKHKVPLWRVCLYIALSAIGVWQMVKPLVSNSIIIWVIGGLAVVCAGLFGYATARNRKRAGAKKEENKQKKETTETALVPKEK